MARKRYSWEKDEEDNRPSFRGWAVVIALLVALAVLVGVLAEVGVFRKLPDCEGTLRNPIKCYRLA